MVRAVRGRTADAPALKANAGISTIRGRNLKKPYTHSLSSWPEGGRGSVQAARAVGHRHGVQEEFSASTATMASAACLQAHIAVSRVDPDTSRAIDLDKAATKRLSR